MANSILQDRQGPDWPLGFIKVATAGTPVNLMSVVDSTSTNKPESATSSTSDEYTPRAQQIIFQAMKPGASHGTQNNAGNIYIVRKGDGTGSANRDDTGTLVATLAPGQTFVLASAPLDRNVFSPYRYSIDADNNNDGAFVTLLIQ